jgi:hypothetical protein
LQDAAEEDPVEEKDEISFITSVEPQFEHCTVSASAFF